MLAAALYGTARRLAADAGSIDEARRELAELAAGRHDLISQEAGLMAGYWSADVWASQPVELLASGLLLVSGPIDFKVLEKWVEIGRARASAPVHGTQ